jgi:transposase
MIEGFFPQDENSTHHKRSLLNAVLYLKDNGIKWRAMPKDYPPWSTVHSFYYRARVSGLWEKTLQALVKKTV